MNNFDKKYLVVGGFTYADNPYGAKYLGPDDVIELFGVKKEDCLIVKSLTNHEHLDEIYGTFILLKPLTHNPYKVSKMSVVKVKNCQLEYL